MFVTLMAIIGGALLFALFGALQPVRPHCDHKCAGCASVCGQREPQDHV